MTKKISRIRRRIRARDYYLSSHAEEEMIDDDLDRFDVEHAILHGIVQKKLTQDVRGLDIESKVQLKMDA